jgi:micrococcal nuclease
MYEYSATILKVVDGDTVDVSVDLGFGVSVIMRLRLSEINTEELHDKDMQKRAMAVAAKDRVQALIIEKGDKVKMNTFKDKKEKYGRYLAKITLSDGSCLNEILIKEGLAKKYGDD